MTSDLPRLLLVFLIGVVLALITMFGLVASQSGAETVKLQGTVYGVTTPLVK